MYDVLFVLLALAFGFVLAFVTGIRQDGVGAWLVNRGLPQWFAAMDKVDEDDRRGGDHV